MNLAQQLATTYLARDPGVFHPAVGGAMLQATFAPGAPGSSPSNPYPSFGSAPATTSRGPSPMEGQIASTPGIPDLSPIYFRVAPPPPSTLQNYIPLPVGGPPVGVSQPGPVGSTPSPSPAPATSNTTLLLAGAAALLALLYFGNEEKKKGRRSARA